MKGLMVWAHSNCRSTMALYENLAKEFQVPLCIVVYDKNKVGNIRTTVGFKDDEFAHLKIGSLCKNYQKMLLVYHEHKDWYHFFGCFQKEPLYRRLMFQIYKDGGHYCIGTELPCNMFFGFKRILKSYYLKWLLPQKVKRSIRNADFLVSYSGDATEEAIKIGWKKEKVIPFGYFSPPIEGTHLSQERERSPFHILTTGLMAYHRGHDVLVEALIFLKRWGYEFKATFTQKGPSFEKLRKISKENNLPIDFAGFVPLDKLIHLYETCSVYVGTGRDEPWGMRLNDVLQCGTPLVVSRGMGGVQLVDEYHCGSSFAKDDAIDLAKKLARMIDDKQYYVECLKNAQEAAKAISPEQKAKELVAIIKRRFHEKVEKV